jgi:hypothetical protein
LDLPQGCFTPDGTCNAIDLVECRFIYAFGWMTIFCFLWLGFMGFLCLSPLSDSSDVKKEQPIVVLHKGDSDSRCLIQVNFIQGSLLLVFMMNISMLDVSQGLAKVTLQRLRYLFLR